MRPCFVKTAKMAGISTAIAVGACVVAYKLHKVRNSRNKAKDKRKMEYDEIIKQLQNLEGSDVRINIVYFFILICIFQSLFL